MAEYMNKERFLSSMGLRGDETKYGNRDSEHKHKSYSTWMAYEIIDSVEDSIEEDVAPVVHARWVKDRDGDEYCENCSRYMPVREVTGDPSANDYCPNCGAKMDLKEEDNHDNK